MVDKTAKPADFLANAHRCGVVDHRRFDEIVRDVYGEENPSLMRVSDVKPLASKLIEEGVLTYWQFGMLLMGRWKGFVLDGYELRDAFCKRTEEQPFVFLARRVDTPDIECLIEVPRGDTRIRVICSRPRPYSLSEWAKD
jgi:hypothetical protein